MRFNNLVHFFSEADRKYNPESGEYEGGIEEVATVSANVTDLGATRSVELFGKYDASSKVVRTVEPIKVAWSYLTIDDDEAKYALQTSRQPLKNASLIVGETS